MEMIYCFNNEKHTDNGLTLIHYNPLLSELVSREFGIKEIFGFSKSFGFK